MLSPRSIPRQSEVARYYDEFGFFYRHLWGERLHHGVWDNPEIRTVAQATARHLELVTAPLDLQSGRHLVDIGCGYGADARSLAETFGVSVTALTLSPHQAELASAAPPPPRGEVRIDLADWLSNDYPEASFDAAIALESFDHMPDKAAFFRQLARTLKPGGCAAIACWSASPDLTVVERALLRRLCHDGRLPSLGSIDHYSKLAAAAGLLVENYRDLTEVVSRTWRLIGRRALASLFTKPAFLAAVLRHAVLRPGYAFTIPNILLAYHIRALHYGVLWLKK